MIMQQFEIAIEILDLILDKSIPFNLATKNTLNKYSVPADERANVVGLVGCELRHHFLFEALVKEELPLEEGISHSAILLMLANHHFYLKFDAQEVLAIASRVTNVESTTLEQFLNNHQDKNKLIPEKYERGSFEYLSLRYNCPVWLVKMLNKHFGRPIAYKILQTNTHPVQQTYKLNGIEQGRVLLDPNFVVAPVEDMVIYIGKGNARTTDFYKNRQLIPERMAFKATLDNIKLKSASNVAIFSGYANTLYIDIAKRLGEGSHVDLITSDINITNDARRNIAGYGLKNVSLYEEKAANLLAVISEKVDYFFMLARNSNFDLLATNADYFLRFNRQDLDSIMNEQRYSLEEAASLINDGGELIYMIPTLNKKESKQIISEFLLIHNDFSLLEERQHFPFEEYNCSLYVARMMKTNKK